LEAASSNLSWADFWLICSNVHYYWICRDANAEAAFRGESEKGS
jgi:hypothetical protein